MSRGWLIVFAKAPRPGLVKTRLNPPLTLDQCAEFYTEILSDVLAATARYASEIGLEPVVAYHPPSGIDELIHLAPSGFRFQLQHGEDLGERMANAAAEASAAGASRIMIRGSDSPALPFACFEEAMAQLDGGGDVVLTPDQGGGYALIALRHAETRLFDPPMSTTSVCDQTLEIAANLGLSASLTRAGFDLDTVGDLQLLTELSEEEVADLCPRSVQYLRDAAISGVL